MWYNIPLELCESKNNDIIGEDFIVRSDWPWVYNFYN